MPAPSEFDRRAHALFMRVMEEAPAARRAFIDASCAADAPMRTRLLALLDAADRADAFLAAPALGQTPGDGPPIPDAVGDYLVVGVLGVGGMATVYEAIQERPKRRVALKVMRDGMTNADAYLRFRIETETLARLQHPGIAQIFEAGAAHIGQPAPAPFFAMELIPDALPITAYAARHALSLRERIDMFASVCDAVHHGHRHGVIHRDLKPANVLVDGEGRPKVIDFGVARIAGADGASLTAVSSVRHIVGTLNYISPEQCDPSCDIDTRTDVYSLGVMLYELVCDRLPHDVASMPIPAALRAITQDPPRRPEVPNPRANHALEAVIGKAIARQPERRYESAAALAADLRRFLTHQPVDARPPTVLEQCRLFARRNPALVAAGFAAAAGVAVIAAVSTGFAIRLADEVGRRRVAEQRSIVERDEARWQAYTAQIAGALSAMKTGEFEQMRTRLAAGEHQRQSWEWGFLSRLAERSVGVIVHDDMVLAMVADSRSDRVVTGAQDGAVRVWRDEGRTLVGAFHNDSGAGVTALAFTVDDQAIVCGDELGAVRLLDARGATELATLGALPARISSVVALPDRRIIAAGADGSAMVWPAGQAPGQPLAIDQQGGVRGVAASADGALLATYNDMGEIWIRRADTLEPIHRLDFGASINQVNFSHDPRRVAAVGGSGRVLIWSTLTGALERAIEAAGAVNTVRSVAFSHDGALVAAGLIHRGVRVYSVADGSLVGELAGHADAVSALLFGPNDETLLSASWDRTVRRWKTAEIEAPAGSAILRGHRDYVRSVDFSPDGALLASASSDGSVRFWDADLAAPIATAAAGAPGANALDFSPDGRSLAVACEDGLVRILAIPTGALLAELTGHQQRAASIAFDPAGTRVAAGGEDGTVRVWRLDDDAPPLVLAGHTSRVNSLQFSPDGSRIATGSRDKLVLLWDAATGAPGPTLEGHQSDVFAVLFSPDGRRLFSGSRDQTIRVWAVPDGRPLRTLDGHGQSVTCLAINPDATRLAVGSWFGEIVLFDMATLDLIASFRAHDSAIRGVVFSPDGRWIASASYDATVRLFDSAPRAHAEEARRRAIAGRAEAERLLAPLLADAAGDTQALRTRLVRDGLDQRAEAWIKKAVLAALAPPDTLAALEQPRP